MYPLGIWRHFPILHIYLPFNTTGPIIEHQHIEPSLSSKRFKPTHYGDSMIILIFKIGIIFELSLYLMNGHREYGLITNWFLLFFLRHHHVCQLVLINYYYIRAILHPIYLTIFRGKIWMIYCYWNYWTN